MPINPITSSEFAVLSRTVAPNQTTVTQATDFTPWVKDTYNAATLDSPYPSYEKSAIATSVTFAMSQESKIGSMSFIEVQLECARLRKETREADYSGMSDVEIYQDIYDRYCEVFGEDIIGVPSRWCIPGGTKEEDEASFSFSLALNDQFGENYVLVNRERLGFSEMTYVKAEQAITQKYAGKTLTVRDMFNILYEMNSMGYNNGSGVPFYNYVSDYIKLNIWDGDTSFSDLKKINEFLDSPLNISDIKNKLDKVFLSGTFKSQLMASNLYNMLASLIESGFCEADEKLYDALMDHLSKNPTSTTIGGR